MGKLQKGDREVEQELYVVENLHKQLLERPAVEALELEVRIEAVYRDRRSPISSCWGVQQSKCWSWRFASKQSIDRRSPIDQFPKLFQGLGKLEGEYSIQLQELSCYSSDEAGERH